MRIVFAVIIFVFFLIVGVHYSRQPDSLRRNIIIAAIVIWMGGVSLAYYYLTK